MTSPLNPDQARYAAMRWNTPLSIDHAELLLDRLELQPDADVLDLGCGWGELLLRAVEASGPSSTGVGIDTDEQVLARGRVLATAKGLDDRVHFVHADSAAWDQPADRVLCIGASHAWASVELAMHALAQMVLPGGRVLFGEGCWEQPPTAAAATLFGEGVVTLAEIVRLARAAGWHVLHLSAANQREWDDFEATWRRSRQQWLFDHPRDDRASDVRDTLDAQLKEYVEVYRGVLGFAYLVLGR